MDIFKLLEYNKSEILVDNMQKMFVFFSNNCYMCKITQTEKSFLADLHTERYIDKNEHC